MISWAANSLLKSRTEPYVGGITYLPIQDGSNMYLTTVIDCYSRRLVGFAIADHRRTSLAQDAVHMAKDQHGSLTEAIFPSDHGSVYTSNAFQDTCTELGIRQSMGGISSGADNALAESFNAAVMGGPPGCQDVHQPVAVSQRAGGGD